MLVSWSDPKVEPAFLKKVRAAEQVLECHHVTGAWNHLLKVRLRNTKSSRPSYPAPSRLSGRVERTETIITLSTAKETWALKCLTEHWRVC